MFKRKQIGCFVAVKTYAQRDERVNSKNRRNRVQRILQVHD